MKQTKGGQLSQQFTHACRYTNVSSFCFSCNEVASLDMVPDCMPYPPIAFMVELALGRQDCSHTERHRGTYRKTHTEIHSPRGSDGCVVGCWPLLSALVARSPAALYFAAGLLF